LLSCEQFITMIYDNLKLYSQNIHKNSLIVNTILETQLSFNIIFIQEPPWSVIQSIPSSTSCKGEELVGVTYHLNWLTFSRSPSCASEFPRVIAYINTCISSLWFSLRNNILNHRDLFCIFFFNQESIFFLINIYSDLSQSALKYPKDTKVNINNVLIMTSDFNIRNNFWDPDFPYYSIYRDILFKITDSFQLELSKPTKSFSTRYSDNDQDSNSILDLIFLWPFFSEFNNHHIHPDWRLTSDHTSISVDIPIFDEHISNKRRFLIKNSNKENHFLKELVYFIKKLDTSSIHSIKTLENIIQMLAINIKNIWLKYSKIVNITKYSKVWWDEDCRSNLNKYQQSCSLEDWKEFKSMVRKSKHIFFDNKITKIANKKCGPWKLMNWVKKWKLLAVEAI